MVPFILGGAWAFALTCKLPEGAFLDLIPLKIADPPPGLVEGFASGSEDGEATAKNAEVAAVATMMRM